MKKAIILGSSKGIGMEIANSLRDLDIELISPSGQVIFLQTQGGNSANLGEPWATGTVDGSSNNTTPGVGYQYCFVPDDTFPTLTQGVQTGGTFVSGDGPNTYNDSFVLLII